MSDTKDSECDIKLDAFGNIEFTPGSLERWTKVYTDQLKTLVADRMEGALFCGHCGRLDEFCACEGDLEATPEMTPPGPPPVTVKPALAAPKKDPVQLIQDRVAGQWVQGLPNNAPPAHQCYFCGPTRAPVTKVSSSGATICYHCAHQHLTDE